MNEQCSKEVGATMPDSGNIHLWLLNLEQFRLGDLTPQSMRLSAGEWQRSSRFATASGRLRYQLTRTLVRSVLSGYCPDVAPVDWHFSSNEYGKPYIAGPLLSTPLYFNVSHCEGWLAMAVSCWPDVGVDVERITSRRNTLAVAKRYFHQQEYGFLCDLAPERRGSGFFELWTLKEAFSKARGGALVPALGEIEFTLPGPDAITAKVAADGGGAAADWLFWLFTDSSHRLALALHCEADASKVSCVIREIDSPLDPGQVRDSAMVLERCSDRLGGQGRELP